jgi:hypothetical protein
MGALYTLATIPKMTPRAKHIGVKYFWFRSHVGPVSGINIIKVASENQLADPFTKGLTLDQFTNLRQKLMGWTAEAREGVSYLPLFKYRQYMMGTHRPVMSEREDLSPRQNCWGSDTGRTRSTSGYDRTRSAPIPINAAAPS